MQAQFPGPSQEGLLVMTRRRLLVSVPPAILCFGFYPCAAIVAVCSYSFLLRLSSSLHFNNSPNIHAQLTAEDVYNPWKIEQ